MRAGECAVRASELTSIHRFVNSLRSRTAVGRPERNGSLELLSAHLLDSVEYKQLSGPLPGTLFVFPATACGCPPSISALEWSSLSRAVRVHTG